MSRSKIRSARWLVPASLLSGACTESGAPSGAVLGPSLTNLGLVAQASELASDGELLLVGAREFQGGGRDLDQDGDALDLVAFVVDLETGTTQNLSVALDTTAPRLLAAVDDRRALLAVSERLSGARDRNGDGDALDLVAFVVDLETGTTQNLSVALDTTGPRLLAAVDDRRALLAVSERLSGARDRNGDGDADDTVPFVHEGRDGSTRPLALALSVAPGVEPALGGALAAFAVSEAGQGRDLDGDGERDDDVLHVYDFESDEVLNTRIDAPSRLFVEDGSVAWFRPVSVADRDGDGNTLDAFVLQVFEVETRENRDSGLLTDGSAPVFAGGTWLVAVREEVDGRDLDGDGRLASSVVHAFVAATGAVRNLAVACIDSPCAQVAPGRALFALRATEIARDRNGDGDRLDLVPLVYDPLTDRLRGTGVASAAPPVFAGDLMGVLVPEEGEGADLDGDGDRSDALAFVVDLATGRVAGLDQEAIALRGSRDFLLLARRESAAGEDWNLDGDRLDVVVHVFDAHTGRTRNTRIASADVFGASADEVLLYADEAAEGRDLNGDRDRSDQVFVLFDVDSREATSLGLAGAFDEDRFGRLFANGRLVFLASEAAQGRDLDGDGDRLDDVLHRRR